MDKTDEFKAAALEAAKTYDLSEASYREFWHRLDVLEHSLDGDTETRAKILDQLVDIAAKREAMLTEDLWGSLAKGGAQIQPVAGCIVLSDPMENAITKGNSENEFRSEFAPKTKELISALLTMGVYADDLFIYRGDVHHGMIRQIPYTLIDIPRLSKQIAICDEIGQICFVSQTIRPFSFWTVSSKEMLKADSDIQDIRYDRQRNWLNAIRNLLLGEDINIVSANRFPKTRLAIACPKPLLTEETVKRWIILFHEKEGKWPSPVSEVVWDKDRRGQWIELREERWSGINTAFRIGARGLRNFVGSSLARFREQNNLGVSQLSKVRTLTPDILKRWIILFHEKEGKWPSEISEVVWDKDSQDNWVAVEKESWRAINAALHDGLRGLGGFAGSSLAQFREENNFGLSLNSTTKILTPDKLMDWIRLFHEKEGKWPTQYDKIIWEKNDGEQWIIVQEENWIAINSALRRGLRGLAKFKGSSLALFRKNNELGGDMRGRARQKAHRPINKMGTTNMVIKP
jgi:hypothetical protein